MAAADPAHRQPDAAQRAVHPHRLQRVGAAGRVEPAPRPEQRADEAPVTGDQASSRPGRRPTAWPACRSPGLICCAGHRRSAPTCRRSKCTDYQVEFGGEIRLACGRGPRVGAHHKQATLRKRLQIPADQMPQPPPHRVAHHRAAHGAAHHEPDPGGLLRSRPGPAGARSAAAGRPGCRPGPPRRSPSAAASGRPREASASPPGHAGGRGQTLTRARPLRRRAARTARPARVRMRSRNPCVLARRRLFGWNVRLLTGTPGTVSGQLRRPA